VIPSYKTLLKIYSFLQKHIQRKLIVLFFFLFFRNKHFCFISQNCLGQRFYLMQKQKYNSPTIGLWMYPKDFLSLSSNLEYYLSLSLEKSDSESIARNYPVGILVELRIFFQHYERYDIARKSFQTRAQRVTLDNVFLIMTDRDVFTDMDFEFFQKIVTNRKLLFTSNLNYMSANSIYLSRYSNEEQVGDLFTDYHELGKIKIMYLLYRILNVN